MEVLDHGVAKLTFTTHAVPEGEIAGIKPLVGPPRIGQLVAAEVLSLGKHTSIENRAGLTLQIFPGDRIVGAFGNRYATDQFEGYVPASPVESCHLLSIGGVCGLVASRHATVKSPTELRVLGLVTDPDGRTVTLRAFALPFSREAAGGSVVLVLGASMNSGKTTVAGTVVRALVRAGLRVAAAKVTGTAAGKDGRFYASCGAYPAIDFTDAGYPATYMLGRRELLLVHHRMLAFLRASNPDYIVLEVADGIFQRETRMLLESPEFRADIDHVFFAANDSLSAECGVRWVRQYGLPLRATSGKLSRSPLGVREAESETGVPCLTVAQMMDGKVIELLNAVVCEPDGREGPRREVTAPGDHARSHLTPDSRRSTSSTTSNGTVKSASEVLPAGAAGLLRPDPR